MKGSVRKRNTSWEYTVDIGLDPISNKRLRKSKGGFRTKKECESALAKFLVEYDEGNYIKIDKITYSKFLTDWIEDYCKNNFAYNSYYSYNKMARLFIIPNIGNLLIDKIAPIQIQNFYSKCINDYNLSSSTIRLIHSIIRKSFQYAIKLKMLNNNPADNVEKPKITKPITDAWNENELKKFLNRVRNTKFYIPTLIAATTGLRRGELLGLKWDNVDLDNGIIYIKEQIIDKNNSSTIITTPLKTSSSNRKVVLLEYVTNILKDHRKKQLEQKIASGADFNIGNFVITKRDGKPISPSIFSREFSERGREIMKEIKIKDIRFHDLRHTHATLLLKAGVNPKIVSERLGHANVTMTLNRYTHVLPSMQEEAVKRLDNLLKDVL